MLLSLGIVREEFHQQYISYAVGKHFGCMRARQSQVMLYLKLPHTPRGPQPAIFRDVTAIGIQTTGNADFTLRSEWDLVAAEPFIRAAYKRSKLACPR